MKTRNLKSALIVMSLLTVSLFTFAKGNLPVKDTKQIIAEKISYPEFAIEKQIEGIVTVYFVIDSDGKIVIEKMRSDNKELEDYVKKEVEKIRLTDNLNDPSLKYCVKLNFDLK
jgi:hypothetical protein